MLLLNLFIFIFGLIVGSFLNCVIYRLETGKSFLGGRSFCPDCQHVLSWNDLVPVFSFLMLGGRCRYCNKKISWQYPLVELTTALLFILIFNLSQNLLNTSYWLLITSFLIIIFVYDLKHYIIPDKVVFPAIVLALIYNLLDTNYLLLNTILAALSASAFFLSIYLISKGKWLGFGDVKLSFLIGLYLGFPNILVALFLAFLIGAIIGLILIAKGRKTLKSIVPFGPFLVIGTFLAMFLGEQIINWYLGSLGI